MIRCRAGYSLVSVLIVTALGGILAVAIMALIDNMSRALVRANVSEVVESTIGTVASILANPDYCDNALRGPGPGDKLVYDMMNNPVGPPPGGNELEVQNIFVQTVTNQPGATAVMSSVVGNPVSFLAGSSVQSIRFREKTRGVGRGRVQKDGAQFNSYAGEVEIIINTPSGQIVRTIPLTVIADETTRIIEGCYVRDRTIQGLCNAMGGTFNAVNGSCRQMINPVDVDCEVVCSQGRNPPPPMSDPSPNPPQAGGYCVQVCSDLGAGTGGSTERAIPVYHLLGFRWILHTGSDGHSTSVPVCSCATIRYNTRGSAPASPAPGPLPPPPRPPRPPPSN